MPVDNIIPTAANMGSYDERVQSFDWSAAEAELGWRADEPLNIAEYCTDRICERGLGDQIALLWENSEGARRTYTYDELRIAANTYAQYLKGIGVAPQDRVCVFMDRIPDCYISFLGILKVGAIVQPLFSAFGPESLVVRLQDADTKVALTTMRHVRKLRKIRAELPQLELVVVVNCTDESKLKEGEVAFDLDAAAPVDEFSAYPSWKETPSVLHYTSGTTGKPKGALHVHGSLVQQYISAKWVLDLRPDDVYWCTADPGWVTGTSYGIIGAWANGVTQLVFDGGFSSEAWYRLIARYRVSVWYSAPTAIRLLMRDGEELAWKHDLSSLRHLISVGEPLNAEAVIWSEQAFGMPFHDSYWQTETGSILITNYPGLEIRPGSMGKPFPGIEAAVVDMHSHEPIDEPGRVGIIAIKAFWPSIMRAYWNNTPGYHAKFDRGWYLTGDRASIDADGYYWFIGRDDDVINTGGHLVGPFEIESALLEHEAVAESAAIGKPDPVNMEVVKVFITLKPGFEANDDLELEIMNFVRKRLSPLAMPQDVEFASSLPKTRSGKIMRRVLRAQEWGEPIGDISTLEND